MNKIIADLENVLDDLERIPRLQCFYRNGGEVYNVTELPEPYNSIDSEIQNAHDNLEKAICNLKGIDK